MSSTTLHRPVMVEEVLKGLRVDREKTFIDATLGCGGHSLAILEKSECTVIGLDLDIEQIIIAKERISDHSQKFHPILANYRNMDRFLNLKADGVLFDLGFSSYQLNNPERGFSYRNNGPLDMRYKKTGLTAEAIIKSWDLETLADILYYYGGERNSRTLSRKIKKAKPDTTEELANIIRKSVPRNNAHKHLGRIFQALRIAVNREMDNIREGIQASITLLKKKGRLVVISYHSTEEKLVLNRVNEYGLRTITGKPLKPTEEEFQENPRCRSAHLRIFEK